MNDKSKIILISVLFIVAIMLIIIFGSITTVPTGFVGVKTKFGQVQDTVIQEGLNLKTPL